MYPKGRDSLIYYWSRLRRVWQARGYSATQAGLLVVIITTLVLMCGVLLSPEPGVAQGTKSKSTVHDAKSSADTKKSAVNNSPFGSLTGSNRGPIHIRSDSLAMDYKHNDVEFHGHVHAIQADGVLTSNALNVKYGKNFHEVQNMVATGNVHISQGIRWCTSEHAVMDQAVHTVVLTGTPICHDGNDQITGTKITVHLDTGKSDVDTATAVIFPQESKTRDNEVAADPGTITRQR